MDISDVSVAFERATQRLWRLAWLGVVISSQSSAFAGCSTQPQLTLTGTGAAIDKTTLNLSGPNGSFAAVLKGTVGAVDSLADHSVALERGAFPDSQALRFSVGRISNVIVRSNNKMQKIDYCLLFGSRRGEKQNLGLKFLERRFIGVLIKISVPALSGESAIVVQAWQGAPHTPPFSAALHWTGDGSAELDLKVSNDAVGSSPSAKRILIGSVKGIEPGVWYSAILSLKPTTRKSMSANEDSVRLYWKRFMQSGGYDAVVSSSIPWGYEVPSQDCPYAGRCDVASPNPVLDLLVGLYRVADGNPVSVTLDNVKVATTFAAADPEQFCVPH